MYEWVKRVIRAISKWVNRVVTTVYPLLFNMEKGELPFSYILPFAASGLCPRQRRILEGEIIMANILLNEQSTLAEIAYCYLNNIVKGCYADSTYNSYRVRLEKHILPIIGDRQVRELKKLDVQNMIFKLRNQANPLSANTIRLVRSVLNRVLDFAVDLEIANRNVAYRVSLPKQSKYQPRIYTYAEIENLLNIAKGTILYIPILLAAKAGLRRSEAYVKQKLKTSQEYFSYLKPKTAPMKNQSAVLLLAT